MPKIAVRMTKNAPPAPRLYLVVWRVDRDVSSAASAVALKVDRRSASASARIAGQPGTQARHGQHHPALLTAQACRRHPRPGWRRYGCRPSFLSWVASVTARGG